MTDDRCQYTRDETLDPLIGPRLCPLILCHSKAVKMTQHRLGIIMSGVTGRMGMNQHLIRSILAIRAQGGVALKNGDRVMPDPILVGRNEAKLAELAKAHGITRWTTNLERGAQESRRHLVLRCRHDQVARKTHSESDCRGQGYLLRETHQQRI